jgi:hypothetical protein
MAADERGDPDKDGHPRVFVSYAYDDERHKKQVLELGGFLRNNGIDAHLDRWYEGVRRDWSDWMIETSRMPTSYASSRQPNTERRAMGPTRPAIEGPGGKPR